MEKFKIGVVSDTHVPDRTMYLEKGFLDSLVKEKVDLIMHAGDVSVERVITELNKIAPVIAVRGNRDFLLRKQLPMTYHFEKFGVKFVLIHGHMGFLTYWLDKFLAVIKGYDRNRYISRIIKAEPEAKVYIFGHTHHAENFWKEGKMFFNPGSITHGDYLQHTRSWGILELFEDGQIEARVINYGNLS